MAVVIRTRCFSEGQAAQATQATQVTLKKGKCKGLTFQQCLAQQPQYCTWLLQREKSLQLQSGEYGDFFQFLRLRLQAEESETDQSSMISPVKSSMTNKNSLAVKRPTRPEGRRRLQMSPEMSPQLRLRRSERPVISGQRLVNVGKYAGSGSSFEQGPEGVHHELVCFDQVGRLEINMVWWDEHPKNWYEASSCRDRCRQTNSFLNFPPSINFSGWLTVDTYFSERFHMLQPPSRSQLPGASSSAQTGRVMRSTLSAANDLDTCEKANLASSLATAGKKRWGAAFRKARMPGESQLRQEICP
eukprot:Skav200921  [mRNA]  locus=scaffold2433:182723:186124:+ [translate_table: standard]